MDAPQAYLVRVEADGLEGDRWEITGKPLIVGRGKHADVPVHDRKASRQHCALVREKNGEYTVEDLFSTNSTWLNGQAITRAVLKPYDRLGVGETHFVFKLSYDLHLVEVVQKIEAGVKQHSTGAESEAAD